MPHPVRTIGRLIAFLDRKLLGKRPDDAQRDPAKERRRGLICWMIVSVVTALVSASLLIAAYMINIYAGIAVESVMVAYTLAARSLCRESMAVHKKLTEHDTVGARKALSMIVGRDTAELDEEDIVKAAVETVAENTSDGVIAPLLYDAICPVLGMFYKAVNTMDSMIGYKNDRYENFGRFAAKSDDVVNFVPARLSAVFMMAGCALASLFSKRFDIHDAYRIYKRDRKNHLSPNSAMTESVCAGSLGLKLGGTHTYGGVIVEKPSIGDEKKRADKGRIKDANTLMFMTEAVACITLVPIMLTICMLIR